MNKSKRLGLLLVFLGIIIFALSWQQKIPTFSKKLLIVTAITGFLSGQC